MPARKTKLPKHIKDFRPPFCPNPDCRFFLKKNRPDWEYHHRGQVRIARPPHDLQVFQCLHCGRYFRSSVFTGEYWKKLHGLLPKVYLALTNGQCIRQAARTLGVSHTTIRRAQRWNARQILLAHLEQLGLLEWPVDERVILDGLRTFANSQFEPLDLNTTAFAECGYLVDIEPAPLRRSGAMTPAQQAERIVRERLLGKPEKGIRVNAVVEMLLRLLPLVPEDQCIFLDTDEEPDYARGIKSSGCESRIRHRKTSSRERRDYANPLWRINHLHRLMRHSLANLKRETIAQSKTLAGFMDRMLLFLGWLNQTKGISERRKPDSETTPAMLLSLQDKPQTGEDLLAIRRFPGRIPLPESLRPLYEGTLRSRPGERVTNPRPRFAF